MNGRLPLFRHFDEHSNRLACPHTLLIDSEQLDSGEALDKNFRAAAGDDDLLRLVVKVKGCRGEDAKDKKSTMDTCWVLGVNNLGSYGPWAFPELADVYAMEPLEAEFRALIDRAVA